MKIAVTAREGNYTRVQLADGSSSFVRRGITQWDRMLEIVAVGLQHAITAENVDRPPPLDFQPHHESDKMALAELDVQAIILDCKK